MRLVVRLRILALLLACCTIGACTKTQSVRIQNSTSDELFVRVSSDFYMNAYMCRSGAHVSAFNREGLFTVDSGDGICLVAEVPKGDDEFDIRERVRNVTAIRRGERCFYMTSDDLEMVYEEHGGRQMLDLRGSLCPAQGVAAVPERRESGTEAAPAESEEGPAEFEDEPPATDFEPDDSDMP